MPKYRPPKLGLTGWVFLAAAIGAISALIASKPVLVAVLAGVLGAAYLLAQPGMRRDMAKLRQLAASRRGESICQFAREFELRSVDPWIVRAVYEQIQAQLEHIDPEFPIRADDRLGEDLCIDADTLDMEVAPQVAQRTGLSIDAPQANPYFGKVRTVRDTVMFFHELDKRVAV